jgi:hypothetical protein
MNYIGAAYLSIARVSNSRKQRQRIQKSYDPFVIIWASFHPGHKRQKSYYMQLLQIEQISYIMTVKTLLYVPCRDRAVTVMVPCPSILIG